MSEVLDALAAVDRAREVLGPTHQHIGPPLTSPDTPRDALLDRLGLIISSLIDAYSSHAENLAAERQARAHALEQADGNATSREQASTVFSVAESVNSIRSFWYVRALEEERDHIRFLLTLN